MTSPSLSKDELRYRVGEPSWPLWMDLGEEEMGRSLIEAIETREWETFVYMRGVVGREIATHGKVQMELRSSISEDKRSLQR